MQTPAPWKAPELPQPQDGGHWNIVRPDMFLETSDTSGPELLN